MGDWGRIEPPTPDISLVRGAAQLRDELREMISVTRAHEAKLRQQVDRDRAAGKPVSAGREQALIFLTGAIERNEGLVRWMEENPALSNLLAGVVWGKVYRERRQCRRRTAPLVLLAFLLGASLPFVRRSPRHGVLRRRRAVCR